jgi:hypothetical protein
VSILPRSGWSSVPADGECDGMATQVATRETAARGHLSRRSRRTGHSGTPMVRPRMMRVRLDRLPDLSLIPNDAGLRERITRGGSHGDHRPWGRQPGTPGGTWCEDPIAFDVCRSVLLGHADTDDTCDECGQAVAWGAGRI